MPIAGAPDFEALRRSMVELIEAYAQLSSELTDSDHLDPRVTTAMAKVPRHAFVPAELRHLAYVDSPLPIGCGKTISQPFMVALMTDLLAVAPGESVLEVGTGLGYQAAVLAELTDRVFTVEIVEELASEARLRLEQAGCRRIRFRVGDGAQGWAEHAPFDRIIVTAASELIPPALLRQLAPGGRMVVPTGLADGQQLVLVEKDGAGRTRTREVLSVLFSRLITSH